jgi:hypothetical protein
MGVKSSQEWFAKGKAKIWDTKISTACHYQQLSPSPEKCQLSFRYLARALVGRKISDGGGRGKPDDR